MRIIALVWLISFVLMIPRMWYAFRQLRASSPSDHIVPVISIVLCLIFAPVAAFGITLATITDSEFRRETFRS